MIEPTSKSLTEAICLEMFTAFHKAATGKSSELVFITLAGFIASFIKKLPPDQYAVFWNWFKSLVDDAVTFSYTSKLDE